MKMAYKDKDKQRAFQHLHYLNNKERYTSLVRSRETKMRKYVQEEKKKPCTDCGIIYPYYVMQYDHLGIEKKAATLSTIYLKGWGLKKVKEEIAKCEVVCSNCHAIRTHNRLMN